MEEVEHKTNLMKLATINQKRMFAFVCIVGFALTFFFSSNDERYTCFPLGKCSVIHFELVKFQFCRLFATCRTSEFIQTPKFPLQFERDDLLHITLKHNPNRSRHSRDGKALFVIEYPRENFIEEFYVADRDEDLRNTMHEFHLVTDLSRHSSLKLMMQRNVEKFGKPKDVRRRNFLISLS